MIPFQPSDAPQEENNTKKRLTGKETRGCKQLVPLPLLFLRGKKRGKPEAPKARNFLCKIPQQLGEHK